MTRSEKDALNAALDSQVLKLSRTAPDYCASRQALQPILDELAKEGWQIIERSATKVSMRRVYQQTRTRSQERGGGTYLSTMSEESEFVIGPLSRESTTQLTTIHECAAFAALQAHQRGTKRTEAQD